MRDKQENRSVLIFGGAGFVGANLARSLLLETSAKVHIFDNLTRRGVQHNLEALKLASGKSGRLRVTIGDVRDSGAVERAARDANEIYQFAAQVAVTTSVTDPRLDFETNVVGTFNILEAARRSGNSPFLVFTSTNKVYGEMTSEPLACNSTRVGYAERDSVNEHQPLHTAARRERPINTFTNTGECMVCRLWSFACPASPAKCSMETKIRAGLLISCIRLFAEIRS